MTEEVAQIAGIRAAIEQYLDPWIEQTLGALGALAFLDADHSQIRAGIRLPVPTGGYETELAAALGEQLRAAGFTQKLVLDLQPAIVARGVQKPLKPLPGIRNIVAVGSAKGGVGKSTVAVNLALAWAAMGARVGILDADIYGPSQPTMLGLGRQKPTSVDGKHIRPLEAFGIKAMSIGFLIDPDQPAVWRGPMVTQALTQLLGETEWGDLDYLVIDMPPGTGDLQLTLAQRVPVAGAIIVTTPQEIAVADARKGLRMFEKVLVPVLGIVENMSTHHCTQCGHEDAIFGTGGGEELAAEAHIRLLGRLPLDTRIRVEADAGTPSVVAAATSPRGIAYRDLARRAAGALACRPRDRSSAFPEIVVERAS
jgi:ATP-binding protein involved in chromosome partitioning